jgi:hypothetical protein
MGYGANSNEITPYNKHISKVVQKGNKFDQIYTKIKLRFEKDCKVKCTVLNSYMHIIHMYFAFI